MVRCLLTPFLLSLHDASVGLTDRRLIRRAMKRARRAGKEEQERRPGAVILSPCKVTWAALAATTLEAAASLHWPAQPARDCDLQWAGWRSSPQPQTQSCQTEAGCYWSTQHNRDILFSSFSLRNKVLQGEYDLSSQYSSLHPSSDKSRNHQYQKRNSITQLLN